MYKTCETIRRQHRATVDGTVYAVRQTLHNVLPVTLDCEVRARTSSRVDPGTVRVTLETYDPVKAARRTRAVSRMRAYHWGAFGMGGALGTAVGMFLEALRQGWTP